MVTGKPTQLRKTLCGRFEHWALTGAARNNILWGKLRDSILSNGLSGKFYTVVYAALGRTA